MRIIVWGINYAPEFTGIAPHSVALCEFLNERGHEVEMVSTFSYYPTWRKLPEDEGRLYRTDVINGVPVHRCWHFVPDRVSPLKRIVHEASFITTSFLRMLALPRPDVFVVVSPPLALGAAAWKIGWLKCAPFVFHVQDLQPDAALKLGMLRQGWFTRSLLWLEAFAYAKAARVSSITRGMLDVFRSKGVPEEKLVYFPNAIALYGAAAPPARGLFRQRNGFREDEFLAVYAGNLGVKQGLDVLIEAARLATDKRVRIVICGAGAQRDVLAARVRELGLPNVTMLPLQEGEDYRSLLADVDVCFITQQAGAGNSFFPSKLLGLLAQGKPVIIVADPESELARSAGEGEYGVSLPPGQPAELARILDEFAADPQRLANYSAAGQRYVQQWEKSPVMENFERELIRLAIESQ
ncbi:MAG: WcaI family glycosyltransferase [Chthoniobacterales bacterium]|nr:WcaI family glycosyltransferase [Chthoniobacterales bacterium]